MLLVLRSLLLLCLLAPACTNATDPSGLPDDVLAQLPPDPGEAGKTTLAGIDSNANGIRDDVERFIWSRYWPEKPVIHAWLAMARDDQTMMTHADSADAVLQAVEIQGLSQYCLMDHINDDFRFSQMSAEMNAATFNTRDRLVAYAKIERQLGGQVFTFPSDRTLDENCPAILQGQGLQL